jgi:hypothetical protein
LYRRAVLTSMNRQQIMALILTVLMIGSSVAYVITAF